MIFILNAAYFTVIKKQIIHISSCKYFYSCICGSSGKFIIKYSSLKYITGFTEIQNDFRSIR